MGNALAGALLILFLFQIYSISAATNYMISWDDLNAGDYLSNYDRTTQFVVVAKDGSGHCRTVQGAVDSIAEGNRRRVKILIRAGIYREKVRIPATKPFVSFIGEGRGKTILSWNDSASHRGADGRSLGTSGSASITIESDYFCAKGITFENRAPSAAPGAKGMQAVALRVAGDKAVFMECRMVGNQDTLFDDSGRHFFWKCSIQGSIDFIFGNARSLYQNCLLRANAASYGAIAASQRSSANERTGFSFVSCRVKGSGIVYLGRAWGSYATIVYSLCNFDHIINPQGWYDWGDASRRRTVMFGEYKCNGAGADRRGRVPWAISLSSKQVKPYLGRQFIDGQDWLEL
ncbi:hypothetical protein SUGI_1041520 [Cryptomeria japonica]|nr:hypothetical protein SUGI_1041520 [Cryptomeria japonica]